MVLAKGEYESEYSDRASGSYELFFVFNKDTAFRQLLIQHRLKWYIRLYLYPGFLYLLRLGFGVMLFASLLFVGTMVVILVVVAASRGGGGGRNNHHTLFNYWQWYWLCRQCEYIRPGRPIDLTSSPLPDDDYPNILEAIFSCVFGDPDLEPIRARQLLGQYIQGQERIPLAKLLPHLHKPRDEHELSTLFNGVISVDENQQVVYTFKDKTTSEVVAYNQVSPNNQTYFHEKPRLLSKQEHKVQKYVAILGAVNMLGVFLLRLRVSNRIKARVESPFESNVLDLIEVIIPFLSLYASVFMIIPLIRYCYIEYYHNPIVLKRNDYRMELSMMV